MTTRRKFLKSTVSSLAAASFMGLSGCTVNPTKPNIIYILADDLGFGDLGCYGQKEIKTPNLDQMAKEGVLFTNHYAGSTVCAPSRCCLMTGKHTGHARIRGNAKVPLLPQDTTIAEILKTAGYRTGLIGKWGLGDKGTSGDPNKKGFDYFYGYISQLRAHNYYPEWLWQNDDKIKLKNEVVFSESGYAQGEGSASTNKIDYSHDLFTDKALSFIDKNADNPFFLYLAYTIPHANNEFELVNSEHGMEVPDYGIYADKDWPNAQKGHAAMISRMDRDIGRLFDLLKKLHIDNNTLVMFSSDNGPHQEGNFDPEFNDSNSNLRGIKRDLYEGGIRVPMIARWPGKIKADSKSDLISAFWDVLPTCAQAANTSTSVDIDGISFLPTLLGKNKDQKKHEYLYWEFHWWQPSRFAIRMDKWKAFKNTQNSDIELFDLEKDPEEKNNIAAQHPDIVNKMAQLFIKARTESKDWKIK